MLLFQVAPSTKTSIGGLLISVTLAMIGGCCAISRLGPCDENEVAARELARLGLDAIHRGALGEAQARFSHALEKCPQNPQARHHLADLLWQQGDRQRAIQEMELAVKYSSGDPAWTVRLGRMWQAQGQLSEALRYADRALDGAPDLAHAWLLRADVMRSQNRPDDAKQAYHRCLSSRAPPPEVVTTATLRLAELYRLEGKPLRALATLQRYEASLASSAARPLELPYEQAIALHALGRYEQAIEKFQHAREGNGENAELLLMLADCQLRSDQHEQAVQTSERLAKIAPHDPRVSALQADLHRQGQRFAGGL